MPQPSLQVTCSQGNLLAGLTQKGPFRPESPPSRSAQALPASPTCLLAQQPFTTGSTFLNKTQHGSPCRSLVLGGLCPGQHGWQPWPTCVCSAAFVGTRNPTAGRGILGIWRVWRLKEARPGVQSELLVLLSEAHGSKRQTGRVNTNPTCHRCPTGEGEEGGRPGPSRQNL